MLGIYRLCILHDFVDHLFIISSRRRRPGTGDIATPRVCPSVTFGFRTVTQKRIAVFS